MLAVIRRCALLILLLPAFVGPSQAQDKPKTPGPDAIDDIISGVMRGEHPNPLKGILPAPKPGESVDPRTFTSEHSEGDLRLREIDRPDPANSYGEISYALAWREASTSQLPVALIISWRPEAKVVDYSQMFNNSAFTDLGSDGHMRDFAHRGYLAAWVLLSAEMSEPGYSQCRPDAIVSALERDVDKIQRVLDALRNEPQADLKHVIILANGAPAIAALALATRHVNGLEGVINISGGIYRSDCDPIALNAAITDILSLTKAGHPTQSLWLYADNDAAYDQMTITGWRDAYLRSGGNADLAFISMHNKPGYLLNFLPASVLKMAPRINDFLDHLGLPAVHKSEVDELVAKLGSEEFHNLAQEYLTGPGHKALAVSQSGKWIGTDFSRTADNPALNGAMHDCNQKSGGEGCHILMLNNEYQP